MPSFRPALAILCLLAAACGRSPVPIETATSALEGVSLVPVTLPVSRIIAPTEVAPGTLVTATIEAMQPNGCTRLERVDVAVDDDARTVTFDARGLENQTAYCIQGGPYSVQALSFRTQIVTFMPSRMGTYRLRGTRGEASASLIVR